MDHILIQLHLIPSKGNYLPLQHSRVILRRMLDILQDFLDQVTCGVVLIDNYVGNKSMGYYGATVGRVHSAFVIFDVEEIDKGGADA